MLYAHAVTLSEARSYIAALADNALIVEASSAYELALLQLDCIHGDDVPALGTTGLSDDRDILMAFASSAVERLVSYGVDELDVELLLAALADAHALDVR